MVSVLLPKYLALPRNRQGRGCVAADTGEEDSGLAEGHGDEHRGDGTGHRGEAVDAKGPGDAFGIGDLELADEEIDRERFYRELQSSFQDACRLRIDKINFVPRGTIPEEHKMIVDERSWEVKS